MTGVGAEAALVGLGAVHGLNPGMGWLFAVALGLQERSRRALWRALPPLLQPQGDGEEPAHPRVESVHGAGHAAKQNESEDASPPASLTWWGRSRSPVSVRKRGSSAMTPLGSTSILAIQPRIPSG